eukprot:jgi/Psemu1/258741/estExt_Genewise1Plus.C_3000007
MDSSTERKQHEEGEDEISRYGGEAWTKIVSASIGSTITALTVTPLDVVKVRQQAAGLTPGNVAAAPVTSSTLPPNKTGGPFRIIRSIFVHEGLAGIYAGLAPTLVMGIPNTVLYFYTYEELAQRFKKRCPGDHPMRDAIPAIAGASARFVASLSTAPLELLRTRQAARAGFAASDTFSHNEGGGMITEFRTMIRNEGVISLFRGVRPTLMRDVPFSAIYWVCIESTRDFWKSRHLDLSPSSDVSTTEQSVEALINGSVSGVIAAAFTTPLDVLKTRSQIEAPITTSALAVHSKCVPLGSSTASVGDVGSTKTQSTINIARNIIEREGISGLWRGNIARCMKVAPACGIMIATYEAGKRLLSVG